VRKQRVGGIVRKQMIVGIVRNQMVGGYCEETNSRGIVRKQIVGDIVRKQIVVGFVRIPIYLGTNDRCQAILQFFILEMNAKSFLSYTIAAVAANDVLPPGARSRRATQPPTLRRTFRSCVGRSIPGDRRHDDLPRHPHEDGRSLPDVAQALVRVRPMRALADVLRGPHRT